MTRLKKGARIALCVQRSPGAISYYNVPKPKGISSYLGLITQRAKIEGFIVFDYADRFPEALADIGKWMAEGRISRNNHMRHH